MEMTEELRAAEAAFVAADKREAALLAEINAARAMKDAPTGEQYDRWREARRMTEKALDRWMENLRR